MMISRANGVRLGMLILTSVFVLGLRFSILDTEAALWFQAHLGYSWMLALLTCSVAVVCKLGRRRLIIEFCRSHRHSLWLVLGMTVFLHLHEPHVMRVLNDEPTHALGALVMHSEKHALMAGQSNYLGDAFVVSQFYASFRQYLYPFLVSLLHDFTGYRVSNVFVLNFLLTPVTLILAYLIGLNVSGRLAGMVAMGLLVTLPLLAQNVTSGGYDVLNVGLLGGLILSTMGYAHASAENRGLTMNVSLAFALLLAAARSESVLYLVPWSLIVLIIWWQRRQVEITLFAAISPLFVLPNLACNVIMMSNPEVMDAKLRSNGEAFFDLANLPGHLAETVYYLFNYSRASTSSVLLSIVGLLGSVALIVSAAKAAYQRRLTSPHLVMSMFSVAVILVYLFILTNFWGSPIQTLATRFSLPMLFVWSILGGWIIEQISVLRERPVLVYGGLVLWCAVAAAPAMSSAVKTYEMKTGRALVWFNQYASTCEKTETLFVAQSNVSFIAHRYAASGLPYLERSPHVFVRALKARLYKQIIVCQTWLRDPVTHEWRLHPGHAAAENLLFETIEEREITPFFKARISRLVGYRKSDGTIITTASDDPDVNVENRVGDDEWYAYKQSLYP